MPLPGYLRQPRRLLIGKDVERAVDEAEQEAREQHERKGDAQQWRGARHGVHKDEDGHLRAEMRGGCGARGQVVREMEMATCSRYLKTRRWPRAPRRCRRKCGLLQMAEATCPL